VKPHGEGGGGAGKGGGGGGGGGGGSESVIVGDMTFRAQKKNCLII